MSKYVRGMDGEKSNASIPVRWNLIKWVDLILELKIKF